MALLGDRVVGSVCHHGTLEAGRRVDSPLVAVVHQLRVVVPDFDNGCEVYEALGGGSVCGVVALGLGFWFSRESWGGRRWIQVVFPRLGKGLDLLGVASGGRWLI